MTRIRLRTQLVSVILGFCLMLDLANAQSASSTINGLAVDNAGGVVPGAQVTITNQGTRAKIETQTNSEGAFSMTGDRKSTRLNSSHGGISRMPSSA